MSEIFTIGYEGATQPNVLDALEAAGVGLVLDVRAIAASRRAGFSKTILSSSLAERGIDYAHLRSLGTPKPGRDAARRGDIAELHRIFDAHMHTPEAADGLERAIALAGGDRPVCLLCFEHTPEGCHRLPVAERIAARTGQTISHLAPARPLG